MLALYNHDCVVLQGILYFPCLNVLQQLLELVMQLVASL